MHIVDSFLNARIAGLALQPYNDALRGHHPGTGAVQSENLSVCSLHRNIQTAAKN